MLQVELKTSFYDRDLAADPKVLAEATVAVLKAAHHLDRTIFVGFDWAGLIHAKALAPEAQCWFTTMELDFLKAPKDGERPQVQVLRHWAQTGTSPWAAGFDAKNYEGSIPRAIKAAGGDGWFPSQEDATPEMVAEAKALGLKVGAWTVNDPAEMKRLIGLGLDGICTDRPDLLAKELKRAG